MSKVKLALVYLGIFLGFVSLGYLLSHFLIKSKPVLVQKQSPTPKTITSTALSPNYNPPPILTRLDFPKVTPGSTIAPKINKPFSPKNTFNTVDDSGNYFLFGVYKTKSGRTLIAGIVRKFETDKNLKLWLEDEFGDLISASVEVPLTEDGSILAGSRNADRALDLSKAVEIVNRKLDSFKDSLVGSRVVVEVFPESNNSLVYTGKTLYLAYLRE